MFRIELLQQFSRRKIGFENPVRDDISRLYEICRGSKLSYLLFVNSEAEGFVSVRCQVRHKRIRNNA